MIFRSKFVYRYVTELLISSVLDSIFPRETILFPPYSPVTLILVLFRIFVRFKFVIAYNLPQSFCCFSRTSVVLAVHNFLVSIFDKTSNNFLSIPCSLVHVTIENSSSQADVQCSNVRSFFVNFCWYICKSEKSISFLESVLTVILCNDECAQSRFICLGSFDYPSAQFELIFERTSCNVRSQVSPSTIDSTVPPYSADGVFCSC